MSAQYFAQINDDNVVTMVAVVTSEFMAANPERYPGKWVETFVDNATKIYAGIGMIYDETTQNFVPAPYVEPVRPVE